MTRAGGGAHYDCHALPQRVSRRVFRVCPIAAEGYYVLSSCTCTTVYGPDYGRQRFPSRHIPTVHCGVYVDCNLYDADQSFRE